jgi:tetratricopeptide (TPR) repeat protein
MCEHLPATGYFETGESIDSIFQEAFMRQCIVLAMAALSLGRVAMGQTADAQIALGDRDHAAGNLVSALQHYDAAIRLDPTSYTALTKAAHDAVDLGEFDDNRAERDSLYQSAEQYARRAVAANPNDVEGHFELARAVGRRALTMGTRDKIKYANLVRNEALAVLKIDPKHAGALHIMVVWNEQVMSLSGLSRMIAKNFLGGKVFGEASWDKAQRYLEDAVAAEPNRITHHLDLAGVYAERNDKDKAIEQYEWIARAPSVDYNDNKYKALAAARLKALR